MENVNLYEFKSHFSEYARRVKEGETVILCERNVPIAEIRPIARANREPRPAPGLYREQISVGDDFFHAGAEIEQDFSADAD
jgi:antitoxin (DNA-binding transcriptional repressor) of toxin-antitoxin stability system